MGGMAMRLWTEPLCNHRKDRGIYIGKYCLPFCARCTGIHMGTLVYIWFVLFGGKPLRLAKGILLLYPTLIDGVLQYFHGRESTNTRRILTGLAAGVGCGVIDVALLWFIVRMISWVWIRV